MVKQHQFIGHPSEDPNEHLGRFLKMINIIKLQLFPFSLRDLAASWFESMSYGLVDNWEELVEAFMKRVFPPTFTLERKIEIIAFKQGEE